VSHAIRQLSSRSRLALASSLSVLALASMAASDAQGASSVAAFRIDSNVEPSHLVPGDSSGLQAYIVTATNVGAGSTDGSPIVLRDLLPSGVAPDLEAAGALIEPKLNDDTGGLAPGSSCQSSPTEVVCTAPESVLRPGARLIMQIPVDVAESAAGVAENRVDVSGGGAAGAGRTETTTFEVEPPGFGFQSLETQLTGPNGHVFTQAGGHPYQLHIGFQTTSRLEPEPGAAQGNLPIGLIRDVHAELPKGFVIDPEATSARCTETQLEGGECPDSSAVGLVHSTITLGGLITNGISEPLYNMVPPPGHPAAFAFNAAGLGIYIHLLGGVNSAGEYELTSTTEHILEYGEVSGISLDLWGSPTDQSHDFRRGLCAFSNGQFGPPQGCETERLKTALLTMPTSCSGGPLQTAISVDTRRELGIFHTGLAPSTDVEDVPAGVDGCGALAFEPSITSQATTDQADGPTGLDVTIHQPQDLNSEGLSTANLKNVSVTLPPGLVLNPSAANGLGVCTNSQIGYQPSEGKIRFSETPQSCPDAAKLGTLEVNTPLLSESLPGKIYLAKPFENPFGNLTAIYLAVESPKVGLVAKLAGKVEADAQTGQLTATFTENPELPIEDIETHFFEGSRAALTTPLTCGRKITTSTLTPWSTPDGADARPTSFFETTARCSASEADAPKEVAFTAGTESPLSGAYSPFVLRIARPDGSQRITGLETTLPEGLVGKLAGVGYCPESGIAQAISREQPEQGKLEQASPSCPASSEVGTVNVTAGSGSSPIPVSGHAYLAGPYRGAPLSLVVIVPAVAGPFDLGTVVDRVALNVGEYDARIHAVADPLPTILDGIPLDVRSIEVKLGRPGFTLNPTSCEAKAIEGHATTEPGQTVSLNNRFQVGECGRLAFKPRIAISLKGRTSRTGHPTLKATVTYPSGGAYANIARAQVSLPHSEFLDQGNIGKACTKPVLQMGACPTRSIYGKVRAWTPLLEKPLEGPVYLVGGYGYKLPALVAELNGQIRVLLVGKVDTGKNKGIRNTFEAVPDAPVEKFVLEMKGGKKYGLLENSEDICKRTQKASVSFTAQNGRTLNLSPKIANSCKRGGRGTEKPRH
jgi:hypothetical protein